MTDSLRYWLAINRIPGIGSASLQRLLQQYHSPQAILESDVGAWHPRLRNPDVVRYLKAPDWKAIERDLAWTEVAGNHIVTLADRRYPQLLREIPGGAPVVLFIRGDAALLSHPQVAMVGSRNPTVSGRETAHAFAKQLSQLGLAITSGLAVGVDAASHQGALCGGGLTIAVAGTGLDRTYPPRHEALAQEIVAKGGALVSEFPPGTPPLREHFPRRNRIIAGLSLGTVVLEAALRSGSLITARYAADQGREVFAVPGSIHNPLARGCHWLIKEGAKLVECADDIVEEFGTLSWLQAEGRLVGAGNQAVVAEFQARGTELLHAFGHEPVTVDVLVERTGLTAEEVSSILMEMEIEGRVASMSGGLYLRQARRGRK
jgi:DNA processing protein